ncbi:MAG: hypothetical protein HYX76_14410 [Acidobacteria bacterium]|nr:hypothetical protein [Acidobacteriota bacterium]
MSRTYRYREEVREELWKHGIAPHDHTPPHLVRDFVSDLYRYEIRRLRARLLEREFPKHEYAARVLELRNRYAILSLPLQRWTLVDC